MIRKSIVIFLLLILFSNISYADVPPDNETRYGLSFDLTNSFFPGNVKIDDTYIYEDGENYVVTVLYSGGSLVTDYSRGNETAVTSFFNPPNGDQLMIIGNRNFYRVSSSGSRVQYRVNKEDLLKCNAISIFLYDKIIGFDDDRNISLNFKLSNIDFDKVPTFDQISKGYDFSAERIEAQLASQPSFWAQNKIEELQINGIYRNSAFDSFKNGITRLRFVYLIVELYESLVGSEVTLTTVIPFTDTDDVHALKAAQIGITSGIGNQQFGPDIILTREQMATFVVKTLILAGADLNVNHSEPAPFSDHDHISDWAKESIYISKENMIINGVGDNAFAPKLSATNEQSLVLVHSILSRFGDLKHYKEIDQDRIYIRYDNTVFKAPLNENVLVNRTVLGNELYLRSYEDLDQLLSIAHDADTSQYEGLDRVIYYDTSNVRQSTNSIPVHRAFERLGIEYTLEHDPLQDIYIIELLPFAYQVRLRR